MNEREQTNNDVVPHPPPHAEEDCGNRPDFLADEPSKPFTVIPGSKKKGCTHETFHALKKRGIYLKILVFRDAHVPPEASFFLEASNGC